MTALALDIVTTAAILFAVAAGLLIVFGVMKIINFAHGGFLTIGGYSALDRDPARLEPWWSLGFAVVIGRGLRRDRRALVVRPLYARPLDAILATWGLGIVIGQVITSHSAARCSSSRARSPAATAMLGESYSQYRLIL